MAVGGALALAGAGLVGHAVHGAVHAEPELVALAGVVGIAELVLKEESRMNSREEREKREEREEEERRIGRRDEIGRRAQPTGLGGG